MSVLAVVESGVQAGLTPHTSDLVIVRDPSTTTLFFPGKKGVPDAGD